MTLKNQNPWKLLSIGLLGIIAIGLITPIDAAKPPDSHQTILDLLLDSIFGLEAISNDIGTVQSSVDNINSIVTEIGKERHVIINTFVELTAGEKITIPVLDFDGVKSYQGQYTIKTGGGGTEEDALIIVRCYGDDFRVSDVVIQELRDNFVCKSLEITLEDRSNGGAETILALVQYTVSENETINP